jgi:hypothetical protein
MCVLFNAVLFYALVPGVIVSLPPGGSPTTKLVVHALVFAVVHYFLKMQFKNYLGY